MDSFRFFEATNNYKSQLFDPALMTWKEFYNAVNPQCKTHGDNSYDFPLSKFRDNKSKYPTVLYRKLINGISFEFRMFKKDRYEGQFAKIDPETQQPVRINNEIQFYTVQELEARKFRRWEYSFGVFHDEQQVGETSDEWGCVLVMVAREYRTFGIGPILLKMAWEAEPGKNSGGMTSKGFAASKRVHGMFVQDYLQKGYYSLLVKEGKLTPQRAKEILAGAQKIKARPERNMGSDDPNDWLLYGENGSFILYDKNFKEMLDAGDEDANRFWYERFIKGGVYVGGGYGIEDKWYLHQLGGETPQLKQFMFRLALSYAKAPVKVYNDDKDVLDPNVVDIGEDGFVTMKIPSIDYRGMVRQEKLWRKQFDKYDEFKNRLLELSEAKYNSR
jgi:hypothetical protein